MEALRENITIPRGNRVLWMQEMGCEMSTLGPVGGQYMLCSVINLHTHYILMNCWYFLLLFYFFKTILYMFPINVLMYSNS